MALLQAPAAPIGGRAEGRLKTAEALAIIAAFIIFFVAALYRFGVFGMFMPSTVKKGTYLEVAAQCVTEINEQCEKSKDCAGKLASLLERKSSCIKNKGYSN